VQVRPDLVRSGQSGQVTLVDVDRSTPPYARVRPVARRRGRWWTL